MNNLNALPGSEVKIVSTSNSVKNTKGYKEDETFERLLLSHDDKIRDFLSYKKDMPSPDNENLLTIDYLEQLAKHSGLSKDQVHGQQGSVNIELYDQKSHAIGKLSYIEKQSDANGLNKLINSEPNAAIMLTKKNINAAPTQLLVASEFKSVKLIGYSLLNESNITNIKLATTQSLTPLLVKDMKYEREKIIEIKQGDKAKIYIRNYFTPIEELSAVVSQYLLRFRNKVNFVINGKVR